jgi:DNA-binding NarL/FixJ family response regulator
MKPPRLRVALADDHLLVRAGIRALIADLPGVEVVGEAGDTAGALALLRTARPDLLLADIGMKGGGGLAVLDAARAEGLPTRILIVSMHANDEYVQRALRAGAAGYLLKDAAASDLAQALAAVTRGETYLSPALARAAMQVYLGAPADPLTPRQRQTLRLIAEGRSTKEIAAELGVGTKTVETYRAQIRERLGIPDIAGLVKYAQRLGLIPPEA